MYCSILPCLIPLFSFFSFFRFFNRCCHYCCCCCCYYLTLCISLFSADLFVFLEMPSLWKKQKRFSRGIRQHSLTKPFNLGCALSLRWGSVTGLAGENVLLGLASYVRQNLYLRFASCVQQNLFLLNDLRVDTRIARTSAAPPVDQIKGREYREQEETIRLLSVQQCGRNPPTKVLPGARAHARARANRPILDVFCLAASRPCFPSARPLPPRPLRHLVIAPFVSLGETTHDRRIATASLSLSHRRHNPPPTTPRRYSSARRGGGPHFSQLVVQTSHTGIAHPPFFFFLRMKSVVVSSCGGHRFFYFPTTR